MLSAENAPPVGAPKAPLPVVDAPKAPVAGFTRDDPPNELCPNADVAGAGWPNAEVVEKAEVGAGAPNVEVG